MSGLTYAELGALADAKCQHCAHPVLAHGEVCQMPECNCAEAWSECIIAVVQRIVAARVEGLRAEVAAIADKWEAHANYVAGCSEGCGGVVDDLRDALRAAQPAAEGASGPEAKWADMYGADPGFTGGQDVSEYLDESRGEA